MSHTKRSPEFQTRIDTLVAFFTAQDDDTDEYKLASEELIQILKRNTTDSGCMVKAKDDEPVFVLRGHDDSAGSVVRTWAEIFKDRQ